jgi:hypothetical protein
MLLANAVSSPVFYRVWCLTHPLDLVIKAAANAIHDVGGFPFISTIMTAVGWLRRQETLLRQMGSKCPYYINVRGTSVSKVLKWMLANRSTVCDYFTTKTFASAPPLGWWLIAKVVNHFLLTVNITFEAPQVESHIVSKPDDSLSRLLAEIQQQFSAERDESLSLEVPCSMSSDSMSKGQFQVPSTSSQNSSNFDGMHHLIQGIDEDAHELYTALDPESKRYAIVDCATLYLHSMNGTVTVLGGRKAAGCESEPRPPCLPRELLDTLALELVSLVASHKAQLRSAFEDEFLQNVCQQQKELVRVSAKEPALIMQLRSKSRNALSQSWYPCGSRFKTWRSSRLVLRQ